jgi:hypothetical protein
MKLISLYFLKKKNIIFTLFVLLIQSFFVVQGSSNQNQQNGLFENEIQNQEDDMYKTKIQNSFKNNIKVKESQTQQSFQNSMQVQQNYQQQQQNLQLQQQKINQQQFYQQQQQFQNSMPVQQNYQQQFNNNNILQSNQQQQQNQFLQQQSNQQSGQQQQIINQQQYNNQIPQKPYQQPQQFQQYQNFQQQQQNQMQFQQNFFVQHQQYEESLRITNLLSDEQKTKIFKTVLGALAKINEEETQFKKLLQDAVTVKKKELCLKNNINCIDANSKIIARFIEDNFGNLQAFKNVFRTENEIQDIKNLKNPVIFEVPYDYYMRKHFEQLQKKYIDSNSGVYYEQSIVKYQDYNSCLVEFEKIFLHLLSHMVFDLEKQEEKKIHANIFIDSNHPNSFQSIEQCEKGQHNTEKQDMNKFISQQNDTQFYQQFYNLFEEIFPIIFGPLNDTQAFIFKNYNLSDNSKMQKILTSEKYSQTINEYCKKNKIEMQDFLHQIINISLEVYKKKYQLKVYIAYLYFLLYTPNKNIDILENKFNIIDDFLDVFFGKNQYKMQDSKNKFEALKYQTNRSLDFIVSFNVINISIEEMIQYILKVRFPDITHLPSSLYHKNFIIEFHNAIVEDKCIQQNLKSQLLTKFGFQNLENNQSFKKKTVFYFDFVVNFLQSKQNVIEQEKLYFLLQIIYAQSILKNISNKTSYQKINEPYESLDKKKQLLGRYFLNSSTYYDLYMERIFNFFKFIELDKDQFIFYLKNQTYSTINIYLEKKNNFLFFYGFNNCIDNFSKIITRYKFFKDNELDMSYFYSYVIINDLKNKLKQRGFFNLNDLCTESIYKTFSTIKKHIEQQKEKLEQQSFSQSILKRLSYIKEYLDFCNKETNDIINQEQQQDKKENKKLEITFNLKDAQYELKNEIKENISKLNEKTVKFNGKSFGESFKDIGSYREYAQQNDLSYTHEIEQLCKITFEDSFNIYLDIFEGMQSAWDNIKKIVDMIKSNTLHQDSLIEVFSHFCFNKSIEQLTKNHEKNNGVNNEKK